MTTKYFTFLVLVFSLILFITKSNANFHIVQGIAPGGGAGIEACPSNYYNCKCLVNGDRAVQVTDGRNGIGSLEDRNYFQVKRGLCGLGALNFYKQADGSWKFYIAGGDGNLQGTCYTNKANSNCSPGFVFNDQLVCYSYICGR